MCKVNDKYLYIIIHILLHILYIYRWFEQIYRKKKLMAIVWLIDNRYNQSKTSWLLKDTTTLSDFAAECKSLSRHSLAKQSLSKLKARTPLTMSKPRFKTRKEFPLISSASFSLANSLKTIALSPTTTSRRRALFTWFCEFAETSTKKK